MFDPRLIYFDSGWVSPQLILYALAGGLLAGLILTPIARRLALRLHIIDRPNDRKFHREPIPYLGALALVAVFLAGAFVAGLAWGELPVAPRSAFIILALALAVAAIGLIDDVRGGLSPELRLAAQFAAGVILYLANIKVGIFPNEILNFAITIIWVVGITNAFNLLDNMDGLCAGVAAVAAFFFVLIASMQEQFLVGAMAGALCGALVGFLVFNFAPAKIFLGDMGSLAIGFLLAVVGLLLRFPELPPAVSFSVPIVVLSVAILDTTLVTVSRLLAGVPVSQGGKDHISHRLVNLGLSPRVAVVNLYVAAFAVGILALVMMSGTSAQAIAILATVSLLALASGVTLQAVPVVRAQDAEAGKTVKPVKAGKPEESGGNRAAQAGTKDAGEVDNLIDIRERSRKEMERVGAD